ncbi:MAG: hypothetical protein RML95_12955 [Anaerolineae bacterium]|nr:hypothetical protein [Anaerolineae bacterium]MDW8300235.1 hypothetical protein [Anaerolineae bacterium]
MKKNNQSRFSGFFVLLFVVLIVLLPIALLYYNALQGARLDSTDPRRMAGFLGTGASFAADLSLLAYIFLLVPLMLYGYVAARRHLFVPQHKYAMTFVTILNWAIIAYLMAVSYSGAVPYYSQRNPNQLIIPTLHLLTGGIAQVLATVSLIRMWFEYRLPMALRYEPIKLPMRVTLGLWLITAALGIGIYIAWYGVPLQPRPEVPTLQPSPEATPQATEDASPASTPAATEETPQTATPAAAPVATEEATPAATENRSVDDDVQKAIREATRAAEDAAREATKGAEDAARNATKDAERATKRAED